MNLYNPIYEFVKPIKIKVSKEDLQKIIDCKYKKVDKRFEDKNIKGGEIV